MSYEDYFGLDRHTYRLIRIKREWVPEWFWKVIAWTGQVWLAEWLTTPVMADPE